MQFSRNLPYLLLRHLRRCPTCLPAASASSLQCIFQRALGSKADDQSLKWKDAATEKADQEPETDDLEHKKQKQAAADRKRRANFKPPSHSWEEVDPNAKISYDPEHPGEYALKRQHTVAPGIIVHMPYFHGWTEPPDLDIPWKERLVYVKDCLKQGVVDFVAEKKDQMTKDPMYIDLLDHMDMKLQWRFQTQQDIDHFMVTSDSAQLCGFSSCEFVLSDRQTGLFRGHLSTRVPKDGITFRSGFVNVGSPYKLKSFQRKDFYVEWLYFSHLVLKVRGDGRTYMLVIGTPGYFDVTWHNVYHYPLFTHGGPYWQYAVIPFSKFYMGTHGRIQDNQVPITCHKMQRFSITLCDKTDGPFELEIDYIAIMHDKTHWEKFAYEMYRLPVRVMG